jgi:thiol reductant ABC exporter CydD subunit
VKLPGGPRRPIDGRLLRVGPYPRGRLALAVSLGLASTALTITQAFLLAHIIAGAFHGSGLDDLAAAVNLLLAVAAGRAFVAWGTEVAAHRSGAAMQSALRRAALRRAMGNTRSPGLVAATAGRGIEALQAYFGRFVPALILAAVAPAAVVACIFPQDLWSGVIVLVTLPLIPMFAALIGAATRARVARRWQAFTDLSAGFVDAVRNLPTLKIFGRSREQISAFAELADRHRRETMGTLRVAFVSALALELAATISVAVVAVAVGLRVLGGGLELQAALTVLILAPEAYLPLRRVSAEFHSAAEGVEAASRLLDKTPAAPPCPSGTAVPAAPVPIVFDGVSVSFAGRGIPAPENVSLRVEPGDYLAVTGPTGSGKSTMLALILGLVAPDRGRVEIGGMALEDIDWPGLRRLVAWVPQEPHLFAGTIADNIRFGKPGAGDDEVAAALDRAAAAFVHDLPAGINAPVGELGARLSAGERARIALARALVRRAPLLLLDEITAHLDPITEIAVLDTLDALRTGCTIVAVAHRPSVAARADRVIQIVAGNGAGT